jgi:hypothetical protein
MARVATNVAATRLAAMNFTWVLASGSHEAFKIQIHDSDCLLLNYGP